MSTSDNRVKVGVRIRPLLGMEIEAGADSVIKCPPKRVVMSVPSKRNTFDFDWTFGECTEHREVYDEVCKPLVKSIYEGFNATVFAYGILLIICSTIPFTCPSCANNQPTLACSLACSGQTGSGKTHTMGNGADATEGIIPFAIDDIFAEKKACESKNMTVSLEMSFMEVYMEDCYDLLSADRTKIELRETTKGETYPEGLTIRPIVSVSDVKAFLQEASLVRSTGRTAMNMHSSRSHAICTFYLRVTESAFLAASEGHNEFARAVVSKLHMVDLAGSERAKKTQATGEVFAEGVSINKGLLALGNVIVALSSSGSGGHIPYRDSKITRLLKDSLGGNGKTVMLACASPADTNFEETLNTLRFASRASTIVNNAQVNIDESDLVMDDGRALPPSVAKELVFLRTQNMTLQQQVDAMSSIMTDDVHERAKRAKSHSHALVDSAQRKMFCSSAGLLLSGITEMVAAQKSLLIKCLEEDFTLQEEEVATMTETIDKARELIGSYLTAIKEISAEEGNSTDSTALVIKMEDEAQGVMDLNMSMDMSFLPPIMKLIEDLERLQEVVAAAMGAISQFAGDEVVRSKAKAKQIKSQQNQIVLKREKTSEFAMEGSSVDRIMELCCGEVEHGNSGAPEPDEMAEEASDSEGDVSSIDECFYGEEEAAMQEKDDKFLSMIKIAEQYKATIVSLRAEIQNLDGEKQRLAVQDQHEKAKHGQTAVPNSKIQKELLEKTKALEAKLKQLRQKEVEYARIYQEKERAKKEADQLRGELTTALKKRVEAAKKLKEESDQHLVEKKKLQQAEMQSRRRELQAQNTVQKLNKDFANRERVLRGQLEEKEREVKRQKELILKQQKVKAIREAAPSKRFSGLGNVALGVAGKIDATGAVVGGNNEFSLTSQRATSLDMWLSQELAAQTKRNCLHDEIEGMMESRAKSSRKLHALKAQRGAAEAGNCNSFGFSRESEVKQLEDEVRSKSISLAKHQGMLADLGTVVEKRRFAGITEQKETKYIMHWMFQRLSKDIPLAQRAVDAKIAAYEEQIESLKKQLHAAEHHVQQLEAQQVTDPSLDRSVSSISTAAEDTQTTFRKRSGSSMDASDCIPHEKAEQLGGRTSESSQPSTASRSSGASKNKSKKDSSADLRSKIMMTAKSVNAAIKVTSGALSVTAGVCTAPTKRQMGEETATPAEDDAVAEVDATFDDISSVEDPMDESFRPDDDEDSDYEDEDEHRAAWRRKKEVAAAKSNKREKGSEGSSSSSVSGRKRSIGDLIDYRCEEEDDNEEPASKRMSPVPNSKDTELHFSRRRSIGGTPGGGLKRDTCTPGRQSLAGPGGFEPKPAARKLRRASLTGPSDLEFVHTDSFIDVPDKENQMNRRAPSDSILPPNIESYNVRDLKDLLATRGLTQTGMPSPS